MANWCWTNIEITGAINEINALDKHIHKALYEEVEHPGWIGNMIEYIGKTTEGISCRGSVSDIYKYPQKSRKKLSSEMCICQEDAWEPHLAPIVLFCEKYAPNVEILYQAEEPGCGLYLTNIDDLAGRWDVYVEDGPLTDINVPITTSELKDALEECFGSGLSFDELLEKARDEFDASINQWQFCDICDVC